MYDELPIIDISSQPIELYKVLKIANMVGGGGEAKIVISEGYVYLNGEVETQKRKKIYQDDVVEFNGEAFQINVLEPLIKPTAEQVSEQKLTQQTSVVKKVSKKSKSKKSKKSPATSPEAKKIAPFSAGARKPISF